MGPFTTTSPRLWSGRRALTLGCLIHFLLLARWFMLDPQHTIPTFLSLLTLIQRLFHEHVYLFIAALCSQGAPLHRAKLLSRFFPDCLSQTTCICPWPWLQLYHPTKSLWSFFAHCRLNDEEAAGGRSILPLHETSFWSRNLLHAVLVFGHVSLPCDHWYCGTPLPPLLPSEKLLLSGATEQNEVFSEAWWQAEKTKTNPKINRETWILKCSDPGEG